MAGNLGYAVKFVIDATRTFDHPDADGVMIPAADIARVTAANLNGEFATIVTAQQLIDASV
jgi:nicotinamidase-related amidase